MRRFYYHNEKHSLRACSIGDKLSLTDDIYHHWCQVLRAQVGDRAVLFDGMGGEYVVSLQAIQNKNATVSIDDFVDICRHAPMTTHLALVMSRGERMDYAIQKSCELGVRTIQLLTSHHGELRLKTDQVAKKMAHWQRVACSACEQCGLNLVPKILAPVAFTEFVSKDFVGLKTYDSVNAQLIKIILAVPDRIIADASFNFEHFDNLAQYLIVVGAEGGFADEELKHAYQQGFLSWQIGQRVLRTETAPVVALASLQAWYEAKNSCQS